MIAPVTEQPFERIPSRLSQIRPVASFESWHLTLYRAAAGYGHLEQCSRAQVRVRSCFRLSSGLLFPPTASVGTLQTTPPSSCRGEPFQRHQAADVVGQVRQADLGARPHDANRSHDPTAWRVLLRSEHMLDASAYSALGVVHSHLR